MYQEWIEYRDRGDVFCGRSSKGYERGHVEGRPWRFCKFGLDHSRNVHLGVGDSGEEVKIV
jgi:hypothetical protein